MNIIGIFLNNRIRTGGDRRYLELMEGLAQRGNKVLVIMNTFLDYRPRYIKQSMLAIKYRYRGFPPASWLFRECIKKNLTAIRQDMIQSGLVSVDFLHIHGDTHLKAALFLKKALAVPLFYAFRANDIDRAHIIRSSGTLSLRSYLFSVLYEPINRSREKQVAKYAQLITFQNEPDRQRFFKRTACPESRTVIIPGNIGPPRFKPEYAGSNNSKKVKKILYVGMVSTGKGLYEVLEAVGLLKKRGYLFIQCCILGRGDGLEAAKNLTKKLNIDSQVFFEGFKDPFPYLADCDLMVYPTLYDAFPDTVLEALHTGCPVIASRVGGIPDLLCYDELLFDARDVNAIASKIEKCITDTGFYMKIRNLCASRAKVFYFDWAERFETAMKDYL
jgi:glycosyltransferase involved in cell wall biosynthesis